MESADGERHWTILMERSLQGDSHAYRTLLLLLTSSMRNALRRRARAAGLDVEDLVQEVLLALHAKRGTWVVGTPVAPWVSAIARNKFIDALRRRGQRTHVPLDSVLPLLSADEDASGPNAHDVAQLLAHLTERQRDVVCAMSLQGYSAQETAARLQMSEVAVRVTLHRSLRTLAATFGKGHR